MPPLLAKRRPALGEKVCPHCDRAFNVRGYGRHELACRARHESQQPIPIAFDPEGDVGPECSKNGTSPVDLVLRWSDFVPKPQTTILGPVRLMISPSGSLKDREDLLKQIQTVRVDYRIISRSTHLVVNRVGPAGPKCWGHYCRTPSLQRQGHQSFQS